MMAKSVLSENPGAVFVCFAPEIDDPHQHYDFAALLDEPPRLGCNPDHDGLRVHVDRAGGFGQFH